MVTPTFPKLIFHQIKMSFAIKWGRMWKKQVHTFIQKATLWSVKIVVWVIDWKILGVRDFQTLQASSSPSGIDLETSKLKVKFLMPLI